MMNDMTIMMNEYYVIVITRFLTQAETPTAEPGQKSAYKENDGGAKNNEKLNRIKGEPHT